MPGDPVRYGHEVVSSMDRAEPPLLEATVFEQVLELARRQGEAVRSYDLDAFGRLLAERERLLATIPEGSPGLSETEKAGITESIREILEIDGDNAVLLKLLMEESLRGAERIDSARRGTGAYFENMAGLLPGQAEFDGTA